MINSSCQMYGKRGSGALNISASYRCYGALHSATTRCPSGSVRHPRQAGRHLTFYQHRENKTDSRGPKTGAVSTWVGEVDLIHFGMLCKGLLSTEENWQSIGLVQIVFFWNG